MGSHAASFLRHSHYKTLASKFVFLVCTYPLLTGFVLLSSKKATLPVTPESPVVTFLWNGKSPSIKEKEKFRGGAYQDLSDEDFMQQLINESLDIWNKVPGSFIRLEVARDPALAQLEKDDRIHSIVVEKSTNLASAAYATPNIPDDEGSIVDCDISIADRATPAKDLAFTLTHELGHCLGLGHAHSNYNAIMGYSRMRRDLSLGADDMAGVIYLYPDPNESDGQVHEFISCGSSGVASSGTGAVSALLLALVAPCFLALLSKTAPQRPTTASAAKTP